MQRVFSKWSVGSVALGVPMVLGSTLPSCSSTPDPGPPTYAVCDNLDESSCMFPFPSDHFRKAGGPNGQAFQIDFGDQLPINVATDAMVDRTAFLAHDGFPIFPQIAFHIDNATLDGAPAHNDFDGSLKPTSKIVIFDADTLQQQPFFAEFDYLAQKKNATVIQLRLAQALEHGKRYIVAVQGLTDAAGKTVAGSRGFRALRDKSGTSVAGIEERRAHFEADIFPATTKLGLAREKLQLAWDFTTTSSDNSTLTLRTMRDELYRLVGDEGPEYTITDVDIAPDDATKTIDSIISGVAKVPNFMLPQLPSKPRRLRLGPNGLPQAEGFEDVPFRVQVPKVSRTSTEKASVMQYGHGFLGGDSEANNDWLRNFATEHNFLILSADMQGMNTPAAIVWFVSLPRDITNLAYIADEPMQGNMNHLALQRMMKGRFQKEPLIQKDGAPIYDPASVYYHGNSQGGTQGALLVAMSRDVTRAGLGVPGVSIGYILARAGEWEKLSVQIVKNYPDPYDFASIMSLASLGWDRGDGTNFAPYLSHTPPADGVPKNVLLHIGLEDAQVNNDVSRVLARIVHAKILEPATKDVWGLPIVAGPVQNENVYVDFDYGVVPHTDTNRPAVDATDTHSKPRQNPKAQLQMWNFFKSGEIKQTCDGVCDPE